MLLNDVFLELCISPNTCTDKRDLSIPVNIILSYYAILKMNSLELKNTKTNACINALSLQLYYMHQVGLILTAGIIVL